MELSRGKQILVLLILIVVSSGFAILFTYFFNIVLVSLFYFLLGAGVIGLFVIRYPKERRWAPRSCLLYGFFAGIWVVQYVNFLLPFTPPITFVIIWMIGIVLMVIDHVFAEDKTRGKVNADFDKLMADFDLVEKVLKELGWTEKYADFLTRLAQIKQAGIEGKSVKIEDKFKLNFHLFLQLGPKLVELHEGKINRAEFLAFLQPKQAPQANESKNAPSEKSVNE